MLRFSLPSLVGSLVPSRDPLTKRLGSIKISIPLGNGRNRLLQKALFPKREDAIASSSLPRREDASSRLAKAASGLILVLEDVNIIFLSFSLCLSLSLSLSFSSLLLSILTTCQSSFRANFGLRRH